MKPTTINLLSCRLRVEHPILLEGGKRSHEIGIAETVTIFWDRFEL